MVEGLVLYQLRSDDCIGFSGDEGEYYIVKCRTPESADALIWMMKLNESQLILNPSFEL